MTATWWRSLPAAAVLLAGCGSGKTTYPVRGKLVWEGTNAPAKELAGGSVMFQCDAEKLTAQGPIGDDGGFVLGTYKQADGAVAGKHKVAIDQPRSELGDHLPVEAVHKKYESIGSTDLEVTVEPRANDVTLTVAPGAWMKKQQKK